MLTDSHAHLDAQRFDADRDQVVVRAHEAGVTLLITCGTNLDSARAALALHRRYDGVWATVGVHPHEAQSICESADERWTVSSAQLAELAALAQQPGAVAIGEIGLDYYYDFSPHAAQRAALAAQLALACDRRLPVVLHCREAEKDLMAIVEDAPAGLRGVLHCFMGSAQLADWALSRGLYLGIAGPITFAKMEPLAAIAAAAPLERLLIETDCPYLAPHPMRGKRNEPAYVAYVAAHLAQLKGISLPDLAAATTQNAQELFGVH